MAVFVTLGASVWIVWALIACSLPLLLLAWIPAAKSTEDHRATPAAAREFVEAVVDRLAATEPGDVGIPQPVIAEIAYGIERLPRSKRRRTLQERFELVCSELQRVEWTDAVSHAYGRIKAALERRGTRIEDFDAAIAAHAFASGATLVTSNVDHMSRVPGLRVEDWSEQPRA